MIQHLRPGILGVVLLTLLTGCIFPLGLFALGRLLFHDRADGPGLNANSVFYNVTTAVAMLAGRFGMAALAMALAGRFAAQRRWPTTTGTLPSDSVMFGILVLVTILLVGALSFLPALALGPFAEALQR
jgi:K+-transporting ATPase ATPase A chain